MVQNRVCQLVNIQYPILQGALGIYPSGELAAAVSNAGGLGTIPGMQGFKVAQREIRKAKSLTTKPIAINLPLVFIQRRQDGKKQAEKLADMAIEEGISAIVISAGDPTELTKRYAQEGIVVIVVCASIKHALLAQSAGASIIVASGMEAGGVTSHEQTSSLALIPQVVDAVDVPVIAAGGIVDSRGFVAAIALGAEGIQMGTRFIATHECPAPHEHKQLILKAGCDDTEIHRDFERVIKKELVSELFPEVEETLPAGQGAGMINEIVTVKQVIDTIITGSRSIISGLAKWDLFL